MRAGNLIRVPGSAYILEFSVEEETMPKIDAGISLTTVMTFFIIKL